jgi:hypothetical protein
MAEALDSVRGSESLHPLTFLSPQVITRVWQVGGRAGGGLGGGRDMGDAMCTLSEYAII